MKRISWIASFILVAVLSTVLLSSCNSDDGYSLGNFQVSFATVRTTDGGEHGKWFYLETTSEKLWIAAPLSVSRIPEDGQRVIANYTLLSDKQGEFDHYIRLNNMRLLETDDVKVLNIGGEDKYGQDKLGYIDDKTPFGGISLDGNYVNVAYTRFAYNQKRHELSLIQNLNKTHMEGDDAEFIHLELRYNAFGDVLKEYIIGRASFDIKELLTPEVLSTKKGVVIHRTNLEGKLDKTILLFPKNTEVGE